MNIRLGERDLEIFTYMARLRMLTMNQMAALFYEGHPLPALELKKANGALRVRVSRLMAGDFVRSAPLSFARAAFLKGYFLGPNGIAVLKDLREYEDYRKPRWMERKHTMCLLHGPHHVIVNNFLINLLMLSRCREGFRVLDWLGDRDATFRFHSQGREDHLRPRPVCQGHLTRGGWGNDHLPGSRPGHHHHPGPEAEDLPGPPVLPVQGI